jgi:hypothetical protein
MKMKNISKYRKQKQRPKPKSKNLSTKFCISSAGHQPRASCAVWTKIQLRWTPYISAGWQLALLTMALVRSENKWTNHSWVQPTVLVSQVQETLQIKNKQTNKITNSNWFLLRWLMETGISPYEVEASGCFNGLFIWSLKICDNFWLLKTSSYLHSRYSIPLSLNLEWLMSN